MPPPDRRPRWRAAVYMKRPGMTNGCRVVLLYLGDHMNAQGVVSIPRTTIATTLGVAPPRITEAIQLARNLGFLDIRRRARQHVTAVYQATIPPPPEVRQAVPLSDSPEVRLPGCHRGTPGRTPNDSPEVRHSPTPSSGNATQGIPPRDDLTSLRAAMTRPVIPNEREASA